MRAIDKFEEMKQTRPLTREDYQRMNTIARPNEKIVSELSSSKYADNTEIDIAVQVLNEQQGKHDEFIFVDEQNKPCHYLNPRE